MLKPHYELNQSPCTMCYRTDSCGHELPLGRGLRVTGGVESLRPYPKILPPILLLIVGDISSLYIIARFYRIIELIRRSLNRHC